MKVDSDPVDAALDIMEYLYERIDAITAIDLPVNIEHFHEYTCKLTLRDPVAGTGLFAHDLAVVPGIDNQHVVLTDVIELFEKASSEIYNFPPSIPKIYGQVAMWIFQQRELLWLGGASGRVLVNSSNRAVFSINGKPVVGAPILEGTPQQESDGTIEAFFSTTYLQLFFVIDLPPISQPVITGDSRLRFGSEMIS